MPTDRVGIAGTPAASVASVLRSSAARGVLRELEERGGPGGRFEARFSWLMPRPMRFVVDTRRRRLSCPDLLPDITSSSALRRELRAFLDARQSADLPEHRRIDPARCSIQCSIRSGRMTLALNLLDDDWEYAAGKLRSLVHETCVYLNRYWPEYAHRALGTSLE